MRFHIPITVFVFFLALFASRATAQLLPNRFEGSSKHAQEGGDFHLKYTNDVQAGQKVNVTLTDPFDPTKTKVIEIELDTNGKADKDIPVPAGWEGVLLSAPGSAEWVVDVIEVSDRLEHSAWPARVA